MILSFFHRKSKEVYMEPFKVINAGQWRLSIKYDMDPQSPREWDNIGKMVCFHRRYDLGDKHDFKKDDYKSWDELERYLFAERDAEIVLPLYLYDHSGITISTSEKYPYNDRWDAGQVGLIYATGAALRECFQVKRLTKRHKERAVSILKEEVKVYDQYLLGEVYSYRLEKISLCSECEKEIVVEEDSCGGFYGTDWKTNGIADSISSDVRKLLEEIDN
jgi:hypothetical protein